MEHSSITPLSSPAEITHAWLEQVLRHKLGSSLKLTSWSMKLPETRNGYMSEVCFIQVCFSTREETPEDKRSLFAKFMPCYEKTLLDIMKNCHLAEREVEFYKHTFSKEFREFCDASGLHHPVPEVYWAGLEDSKITIILQDLCSDGFRLIAPAEGNSLKQIKCVLATVAVIHGSGIATIQKQGKRAWDISLDISYFKNYVVDGINKQIKIFEGTPTVNTLKALLPLTSHLFSVEEKHPFLKSIIHGDLWTANVMFSQDDQDACIFDWQFACVGNIVSDITTLLLMSAEVSCYTEHLTEILECYWKSFEQSLQKNGVTVDVSFQDLVCNVELTWMYGYSFVCASLPGLLKTNITEDRVRAVVQFLEKREVFKNFLSQRNK
uniref:CHK kinase-like domain-containing protein n=1 Tax=Scylla olivacea TaxID=85551 RepID=A0A0P4W9V9_SCYOL